MALPTPRYRIERIRLRHGAGFRVTLLEHPECSAEAATLHEALHAVRVLFHQHPAARTGGHAADDHRDAVRQENGPAFAVPAPEPGSGSQCEGPGPQRPATRPN